MYANLIVMSVNESDESNVEFQAYKVFDQHQNRTNAISKYKSNNNNNNKSKNNSNNKGNNKWVKKSNRKSNDNSKTVNVSKTKINKTIKEKQTDNRRTQSSIYKSERLIGYYSPVENNNIENDDNDTIYEIYEEENATEAVMEDLYYKCFSNIDELDFSNSMNIYNHNRKYYKTDNRYKYTPCNILKI